jgi:hypothetical protein
VLRYLGIGVLGYWGIGFAAEVVAVGCVVPTKEPLDEPQLSSSRSLVTQARPILWLQKLPKTAYGVQNWIALAPSRETAY